MSDSLPHLDLSRRESQVMDALYRLGVGTVAEVVGELKDNPGYNTIRNTLSILERKGYVVHRVEGKRYIYRPAAAREAVQRSAIQHVVRTFFHGSLPSAVLAILGTSREDLTRSELDEIARYIDAARREARS